MVRADVQYKPSLYRLSNYVSKVCLVCVKKGVCGSFRSLAESAKKGRMKKRGGDCVEEELTRFCRPTWSNKRADSSYEIVRNRVAQQEEPPVYTVKKGHSLCRPTRGARKGLLSVCRKKLLSTT